MINMDWTRLADDETLERTSSALKAKGFEVIILNHGEEAKKKVLELIPQGAEVFNATSMTVSAIGLDKEINESGRYDSVRNKLNSMDRNTQGREMRKLGAAPDWIIGSVHAVTEDGKALIASASGSQLPGYSYSAGHVIWIVGTEKIVNNLEQGIARIFEHVLPLESERARKAYGAPGSSVNELLIVEKQRPGRVTLIFVKEKLGF